MRRVATVPLTAGILVMAISLVAPPADAGTGVGFWRSAGLPQVDAFGVYRIQPAGVRLSFVLERVKKGRYGAAIRFAFTERHHRDSVRVSTLGRHGARKRWQTLSSANTGHLYLQECLGAWHGGAFRISRCGGWRRRY